MGILVARLAFMVAHQAAPGQRKAGPAAEKFVAWYSSQAEPCGAFRDSVGLERAGVIQESQTAGALISYAGRNRRSATTAHSAIPTRAILPAFGF
jgi:hypothetical protein